jgi:class 3 adenylate cyclase
LGETAVDVASWLRSLGLERYEATFRENDVDAELLPTLTADDLKEIGVASFGHRRHLLVAIAKLNEQWATDTANPVVELAAATPLREDAVPHGGERRQLTVMFCDLVGSTALSEKLDPEELRSLLHAYRTLCGDVIARYDGFVARYVGDGILTYFGWPTAHEEDAERAVRAALEIVHTVKRASSTENLSVRIGIATGPVVVGEAAGVGDQSKLAVGSTPNLAARLQGLAVADQIVIAASTRRLAGNAFELTDLGENDLKGIAEPIHAWRVERALVAESRFDASRGGGTLTPLVGRDEELDLLLRRWSQARDGEGQVVVLSGEPGIGKSRVLSALRDRLEAQGVQALRFQCSPYYVNSAFWPSIDNFERALKFNRDETTDSKLDRLEALIVTQYGRPLADVRFIASILSIPSEARYGAVPMTPQKHKDETLRILVDISEAAARRQPSVMLFEDAHWADPTTLEVLDLLIDRVKTVPLLVVVTHRPEFFQSRWSEQGHVGALNLSKLTRTQSAAMVATLADDKALPAALLEQILTRTDGVPLFVEELTKSILESGELKDAGDHYEYAGSARSVTIPATLRDSLMARLDRFMPVKEIAQIGAAIGREFGYELITAVAPMPQVQLDDALGQLSQSGLAFRRGTPPDAVYTFKHALVQDAAYDSLLKSRRQELHGKIARVIEKRFSNIKTTEPEVLAHHLTAAGLAEAAIPVWQAAGELALKRMALTEAISHLNQGLELVAAALPRSAQRDASELELRTRLGTAWMALKGWATPEVWASLQPALALAKSLERNDALLPILLGLTLYVQVQGRVAESLPWAQEMLDIAKATGDGDLLITGHSLACACCFWLGEFTRVLEHADEVLNLYDVEKHRHLADIINHDPKTSAGIFASMSTWMLGYPDRALRLNDEKDAHARQRGHPFDLGFALNMGAHEFDHRYGHEDLHRHAEECERLGRENSLPVLWAMFAPTLYGIALIREGKPAEGIATLKSGFAVAEAGGVKRPAWKTFLVEGMVLTGDLDNALQLIDEQIAVVVRPGWEERFSHAEFIRLKGWVLSLKGDLEGAERNFLASLDCARHQQAKMWELRTSTSLARLWQSQGKRQDAYELLAPVYGWFTEGFDTKDLQEAKSLLAELG